MSWNIGEADPQFMRSLERLTKEYSWLHRILSGVAWNIEHNPIDPPAYHAEGDMYAYTLRGFMGGDEELVVLYRVDMETQTIYLYDVNLMMS